MGYIAPSGRISVRPWRVRIEHAVEDTGESGAPIVRWEPLGDVFMAREALTGDERFTADQISARQYLKWQMPFDAAMDPDTVDVPKERRLNFAARTYDITRARRIGPHGSQIELITLASTKT